MNATDLYEIMKPVWEAAPECGEDTPVWFDRKKERWALQAQEPGGSSAARNYIPVSVAATLCRDAMVEWLIDRNKKGLDIVRIERGADEVGPYAAISVKTLDLNRDKVVLKPTLIEALAAAVIAVAKETKQ